MVVDGDPEVAQILEVNLAHVNLEVISARDGAQALSKAVIDSPDVILLEAILPDLDGREICRRLKESQQTCHIPVIIIGSDDECRERVSGAAYGCLLYTSPSPRD